MVSIMGERRGSLSSACQVTRISLDPAHRHASQMHWEAYVRFIAVTLLATAFYAYYGQHHGGAAGTTSTAYQKINGGDPSQESS
jgi:hypothetical protein